MHFLATHHPGGPQPIWPDNALVAWRGYAQWGKHALIDLCRTAVRVAARHCDWHCAGSCMTAVHVAAAPFVAAVGAPQRAAAGAALSGADQQLEVRRLQHAPAQAGRSGTQRAVQHGTCCSSARPVAETPRNRSAALQSLFKMPWACETARPGQAFEPARALCHKGCALYPEGYKSPPRNSTTGVLPGP